MMTDVQAWPVRIAALGPVAAGTVLWRFGEQWSVTVLVKGTFELVPDGPMRLVGPEPICVTDRHEHDSPNQSLSVACETAPQLAQAEVVVFGHAHAPPGPDGAPAATRSEVGLRLIGSAGPLIDKRLVVIGERTPGALEPTAFRSIPLGWERCLGGVGCPDNPLGVGLGASSNALPSFLDPSDPGGRVTSLGPIPRIFPPRRALLGSAPRRMRERAGVVEIEPGFDWGYFQCAMADQRARSLRGDEWIELAGLTEERRLRTRLPGAQALARNYGPREPLLPDWIPLVPDLVQIFAHRRRCTVLWRGGFPIESLASAERLLLAAGLELGEPLLWPRSATEFEVLASPTSDVTAALGDSLGLPAEAAMVGGTIDASADRPAGRAALPWEPAGSPPSASDRAPRSSPSGTPSPRALPWDSAPSPSRAPGGAAPLSDEEKLAAWGATTPLTADEVARALGPRSAPFELAPPRASEGRSPDGAVPGAPWSHEKLRPVERGSLESTVVVSPPSDLPAPGEPATVSSMVDPAEARARAARQAEQAEQARRAEQEDAARVDAERREAAQAEAARRKAEADALREAEAQRFAAEQAAARAEAERRAAEEAERRARAAGELRTGMYGAFKRKR